MTYSIRVWSKGLQLDSFCKLEVAGSGTFEQVLPPLVEVKVNPAPVTASADLQRPRSRYFDSWLSYFYLDRRHDPGLVNAGNRLYCKKVKHLICDNNSPRDRKRGLRKDLGR